MRALRTVSINGVDGLGYAEIVRTTDHTQECRGVIVFDEDADVFAVEQTLANRRGVYTGVVYTNSVEKIATFPVEIRHFEHETAEPGATFVARVPAL